MKVSRRAKSALRVIFLLDGEVMISQKMMMKGVKGRWMMNLRPDIQTGLCVRGMGVLGLPVDVTTPTHTGQLAIIIFCVEVKLSALIVNLESPTRGVDTLWIKAVRSVGARRGAVDESQQRPVCHLISLYDKFKDLGSFGVAFLVRC